MSRPHSEEALRKKQQSYCVLATTRLYGTIKDKFLNDCIKRGMCPADLMREISAIYYGVIEEAPNLREKEMTEVKKFIMDKIKL